MKQKIGFYEFINRYCLLIAMFFSFCSTFGLAYSVKTDDITILVIAYGHCFYLVFLRLSFTMQ